MLFLGLLNLPLSSAHSAERQQRTVQRKILALYDGSEEPTAAQTRIHRWLETPLNHLGYVVEYSDVQKALPSIQTNEEIVGVVSWFSHVVSSSEDSYADWAASIARSGKKTIVLGSFGAGYWSRNLQAINSVLSPIGLRHAGRSIELTHGTTVSRNSLGFASLDPVIAAYPIVEPIGSAASVMLELQAPSREGGGRSVVVATGPGGGYAAAGFEMANEPLLERAQWLLDPLEFLRNALSAESWPHPDVTTLYGRRIFYSLIDGDFPILAADEGRPSSLPKIFMDEIASRYTDMPMTFAITPGLLEGENGGDALRDDIAQIWSQKNIEPSLAACERERAARATAAASENREEKVRPALLPVVGRDEITRTGRPAIHTALERLRVLARVPGPVRLLQAPQDETPRESELTAAAQLGLVTIAGPDSRVKFPSLSDIPPYSTSVGASRLLDITTAGGCVPFREGRSGVDAARRLRISLATSDRPHRVRAFSLDYQLSALGDAEGLLMIKALLEEAREERLFSMRTSDYARLLLDFDNVTLTQVDKHAWAIARRGAIQTLRFDRQTLDVDLLHSKGVLGQKRENEALYISLDAAEPAPVLRLADAPPKDNLPGLNESGWAVSALHRRICGWDFTASGFGPGEFVWYGVADESFQISAKRNGALIWAGTAHPDGAGRMSFIVPLDGAEPMQIEARCRAKSSDRSE